MINSTTIENFQLNWDFLGGSIANCAKRPVVFFSFYEGPGKNYSKNQKLKTFFDRLLKALEGLKHSTLSLTEKFPAKMIEKRSNLKMKLNLLLYCHSELHFYF